MATIAINGLGRIGRAAFKIIIETPELELRAVEGLRRFFKQFSFPGGIGSHATPETPGSIHEGGELGYSVLSNVRMRHNDILVLICFIRFLSHLLLP